MKKVIPVLILLLLATIVIYATSDLNSATVKSKFEDEWSNWKSILKTVTTIIVALGGIALGYAYLTNRQESKDHLTKWAVGLVIIAVIRATVLN